MLTGMLLHTYPLSPRIFELTEYDPTLTIDVFVFGGSAVDASAETVG